MSGFPDNFFRIFGMTRVTSPVNVETQPVLREDREVFLDFQSDTEMVSFYLWWEIEGQKKFEKWISKQEV